MSFENIKDKGIMQLKTGEIHVPMHYLKEGEKLVSLTMGGSGKISRLEDENYIELDIPPGNSFKVKASFEEDTDKVKALFDKMLNMNFTHFKVYKDDLIILEFTEI